MTKRVAPARPASRAPWLVPLLSLALSAGFGCTKGGGAAKDAPKPATPAVAVRVVEVTKRLAPRVIQAVAALAGRDQVDVYSKVLGRVTYMGPHEGEPVKANQILFRVDRSDPGETYLNQPVLSPLTGWIGRWRVTNLGEQVSPSDPVVTVLDDRSLKVLVYLPSADWLEVTPETRVLAQVGGQERAAKIETIARAADLTSGRGSVTLAIDNARRDWRAGMFARLRFELSPRPRMLISAASLIITDTGAYVYVVGGATARRAPVQFQVIDSDTVEITGGLELKSRIVTAGANLLGDKSPIKVVD